MHKLVNGSQTTVIPPFKNPSGSAGFFTESGINGAPSYPGADWFNANIAEFQSVLSAAGIGFKPGNFNHLSLAIAAIVKIHSGTLINFEKSIMSSSAFKNTGKTISTTCSLTVNISGIAHSYVEGASVQAPIFNIGTDYAIYATENGLIAIFILNLVCFIMCMSSRVDVEKK